VAPDVDTIASANCDLDLLGHSYFAEAEALLHDIYSLSRRQRMTPAVAGDASFWKLER
jgi:hypothetical protein